MDRCPGRLTVTKKTMHIGTEIYRELVKKMLSYHISIVERKTRACLRCPPRCPQVSRFTTRRPYTTPYKDKKWLPRDLLPSYLMQKILERPQREGQLRRSAEDAEASLERNAGDSVRVRREIATQRALLQAAIDAHDGGEDEKRGEVSEPVEELGGRTSVVTPAPTGLGDPTRYTPREVTTQLDFTSPTDPAIRSVVVVPVIKTEEVADSEAAQALEAGELRGVVAGAVGDEDDPLADDEIAPLMAAAVAAVNASFPDLCRSDGNWKRAFANAVLDLLDKRRQEGAQERERERAADEEEATGSVDDGYVTPDLSIPGSPSPAKSPPPKTPTPRGSPSRSSSPLPDIGADAFDTPAKVSLGSESPSPTPDTFAMSEDRGVSEETEVSLYSPSRDRSDASDITIDRPLRGGPGMAAFESRVADTTLLREEAAKHGKEVEPRREESEEPDEDEYKELADDLLEAHKFWSAKEPDNEDEWWNLTLQSAAAGDDEDERTVELIKNFAHDNESRQNELFDLTKLKSLDLTKLNVEDIPRVKKGLQIEIRKIIDRWKEEDKEEEEEEEEEDPGEKKKDEDDPDIDDPDIGGPGGSPDPPSPDESEGTRPPQTARKRTRGPSLSRTVSESPPEQSGSVAPIKIEQMSDRERSRSREPEDDPTSREGRIQRLKDGLWERVSTMSVADLNKLSGAMFHQNVPGILPKAEHRVRNLFVKELVKGATMTGRPDASGRRTRDSQKMFTTKQHWNDRVDELLENPEFQWVLQGPVWGELKGFAKQLLDMLSGFTHEETEAYRTNPQQIVDDHPDIFKQLKGTAAQIRELAKRLVSAKRSGTPRQIAAGTHREMYKQHLIKKLIRVMVTRQSEKQKNLKNPRKRYADYTLAYKHMSDEELGVPEKSEPNFGTDMPKLAKLELPDEGTVARRLLDVLNNPKMDAEAVRKYKKNPEAFYADFGNVFQGSDKKASIHQRKYLIKRIFSLGQLILHGRFKGQFAGVAGAGTQAKAKKWMKHLARIFTRKKFNPKVPEHFRVYAQYNDQQLGFQQQKAGPVQQAFLTAMQAQKDPPRPRWEWFKPATVRADTYARAWEGAVNLVAKDNPRAKQIAFHTDPKDRWVIIKEFIQPNMRDPSLRKSVRSLWGRAFTAKEDYIRKHFEKYLEFKLQKKTGPALTKALREYNKKITALFKATAGDKEKL